MDIAQQVEAVQEASDVITEEFAALQSADLTITSILDIYNVPLPAQEAIEKLIELRSRSAAVIAGATDVIEDMTGLSRNEILYFHGI